MTATEFNHYKMDIHNHNESVKIAKHLISEKKIKKLNDITYTDCLILINDLFIKEISWIYGSSIITNLFTFVYFSDNDFISDICSDINEYTPKSIFILFFKSYLYLTYLIYNSVKDSYCLKEEDYPVIIGEDFWYHLTGDRNFYNDLIDAFAEVAEEFEHGE